MTNSYESKMMVHGSDVIDLVEVDPFASQRIHTNGHDSNPTIRDIDSSRSNSVEQLECTMKLPPRADSNDHSIHKVSVSERPLATNSKSCESNTFQPKNTPKNNRGRSVKGVSKWVFPPGTENKHSFVVSSVRLGVDPKVNFRHEDKSPKDPFTVRVNRKRRRCSRADADKGMIHPVVAGVEFDKRFLTYGLSQCGETTKEILVRLIYFQSSQAKRAWENNKFMEQIPDEPSRTETSSRIGPRYQARIPSKPTRPNVPDELLPGYDMLWDPKLATEAEQNGQDISGFLKGNHDLGKHDLLHSILHKNKYNVAAARIELEQRRINVGASPKLNEDEAKQFEGLMRTCQKDFSRVAKTLKRKRSECLVHYYNWKASSRRYKSLKNQWNNKWCSVCQDGGLLIVCDGCGSNFHMECVEPPLTAVPEGSWFCSSCKHTKRTGPSIYTGNLYSKKQPLSYESTSEAESLSSEKICIL